MNVTSRSYGKWILSGEHSVLRGGKAILFPLRSRFLETQWSSDSTFDVVVSSGMDQTSIDFLQKVIQCAFQKIGKSKAQGRWHLHFNLPYGSGLGWSAAFCLNVCNLFEKKNWITKRDILPFSLELENLFHGKSSGADLQAIYHNQPILFRSFYDVEVIQPTWTPYFYLFDTNQKMATAQCVQQVEKWSYQNPHQAKATDQKMKEAVDTSVKALFNQDQGLPNLVQAIQNSCSCFDEWGLISEAVSQTIKSLQSKGALAVKPTGSGGGGFVVGIWKEPLAEIKEGIVAYGKE